MPASKDKSGSLNLTSRQQQVLWATVRHYISTAEPVGSKALVEEYDFSVSSATIRNAMGVLERAGLLYQPHTSAGRIPSDSGYRIYVDKLIQPSGGFALQVEQLLSQNLRREDWGFDHLLQRAAQILATLSGCIALITVPQTCLVYLRHLQLVSLNHRQVMLIIVTDAYATQSVVLDLPKASEEEAYDLDQLERDLQILSNFLNSKLRGRSLNELAAVDWSGLDREFGSYTDFLRLLLVELNRRTRPLPTQILISGISEVLRQPEFSELQQVQTILHLLEEEQEQLWPLMFEPTPLEDAFGKRVTVRIGSENPLEPMQSCTLISSVYRRGETTVGSVGVLGPTRMAYENAIAVVEAASDYLSDTLNS
ncbi:heat-inducible transcriptional repressor HrcA [Geitlerinema sp. PCC 7407]|uniref:heat-inducible transcriptional repressor HrcA n=1 Tax=Geitlerinema sp. PCC 7407 TaxID=1173025 RepID=UPI00029F89C1|nr:heat-inducible transcriptional repressor HrcA [Geitlerinema sp. PCC 7407]AFY66754.1 heat-inducible transcription repressor HrcA [Geitlerinema sp. PCC 7407]